MMSRKTVTFSKFPPKIYEMRVYAFAYKTARQGCWMMAARDRDRFKRRIEYTEAVISPILCKEHREKILTSRTDMNSAQLTSKDQHRLL